MEGKKLKIAVLGSTKGTDMDAIYNAIKTGELDACISVVISDRKDAYILERAQNCRMPAIFINPKDFNNRENYDKSVVEKLKSKQIDIILLIGYMRILSPYFIEQYRNRIINIHPSLLPAFAGGMNMDVHTLVLKRGVKVTGCTLHFVTEEADAGPIILQKAVEVAEDETPQSLKEKVQKAEQEIIVKGLKLFQKEKLKVEEDRVKILS